MKQHILLLILMIIYLPLSGCSITTTHISKSTEKETITIGSTATASYEINEKKLPVGYKEYISTGEDTILQRYRYELGDSSKNNVSYQKVNGLETYFINKISIDHSAGEVIWGNITNAEQIYETMQENNSDLQHYCELTTHINNDGGLTAQIGFNKTTQEHLESLTGDDLDRVRSICNIGTIYCKDNKKKGECEYRYNFKNGGGRNDIVIGSLRKLK